MCKEELKNFGGLLISPPIVNEEQCHTVKKLHLCDECYKLVEDYIYYYES